MSPHEGNAIMLIPPAPLAVVVVIIIIIIMIIIILNILISVWRLRLGVQRNGCWSGGEGSRRREEERGGERRREEKRGGEKRSVRSWTGGQWSKGITHTLNPEPTALNSLPVHRA